jgi:hypothetical protein
LQAGQPERTIPFSPSAMAGGFSTKWLKIVTLDLLLNGSEQRGFLHDPLR